LELASRPFYCVDDRRWLFQPAELAMLGKAAQRYDQVRATTLTPGELLLALYDGLFRFLNGARVCYEHKENARGRELVRKAHAIVSELLLALDHKSSPDLCANLAAVYDFALSRLSDANRDAQLQPLDDVIRVLTPLREAWQIAVPKATAEASAKKGG
jgi:flagellar protein FliS